MRRNPSSPRQSGQGPEAPGLRLAVFALCLALGAGGCSVLQRLSPPPDPAAEAAKISQQIEDLRAEASTGKTAPDTHRQLAMLLVDGRNPARQYGAALKELDRYAELAPKGAQDAEVRSWHEALRAVDALYGQKSTLEARLKAADAENASLSHAAEKARKELQSLRQADAEKEEALAALRRENQQLKEATQQLKETIQQLKETIQKLKELDLRMDELRHKTR